MITRMITNTKTPDFKELVFPAEKKKISLCSFASSLAVQMLSTINIETPLSELNHKVCAEVYQQISNLRLAHTYDDLSYLEPATNEKMIEGFEQKRLKLSNDQILNKEDEHSKTSNEKDPNFGKKIICNSLRVRRINDRIYEICAILIYKETIVPLGFRLENLSHNWIVTKLAFTNTI